ncbi:MAG: hypothetical protein IKR85_05870 [Clostridia bacterium]|nr:hypothetical protein [Clostridia bacterium]
MKKLLALLLSLILICAPCTYGSAEDAGSAADAPSDEAAEISAKAYVNTLHGYTLAMPAEWAAIGSGSTEEELTFAYDVLGYSEVNAIKNSINAENDVLYCFSEGKKDGLILIYGPAGGSSNDTYINEMERIKQSLRDEYGSSVIRFVEDDCTKYTFNSVAEILQLQFQYSQYMFFQYYLVSGSNMYIFTFFGPDAGFLNTAQASLASFKLL